jgi:HEAT repeat protein
MAEEGAVECLINLLDSGNELVQRQSAKALANLGVNNENKLKISRCGGIPRLVKLAASPLLGVKIEAIAALANLAVNGKLATFF